MPTLGLAASPPSPGLAANFAVLSAAPAAGGAVTCTNGTITGDVGSTGAAASVVQTTCTIPGSIVAPVSPQVTADFNSAYAAYAPILCDQVLTGTLAGVILAPGVYCFDAAAALTGTLTLNGPPTGTWIFKIGTLGTGALTGTNFAVVMAGGGLPCNVNWQVAQGSTMTDSDFIGTILAGAAITLTRGTFTGDVFATAGVTITGASLVGCPPPPPSADIGITKTVDNPTPSLGSNVTFTVTATNNGPGNATGVQVTDLLPAGLTFVSFVASVGTYDSVTGLWDIGPLANLANATLSIIATVTSTATLTNTATKTAEDQVDPVSGNNSASAAVTAMGADIAITKTVDNLTPSLGSNVTFTINATNNGSGNATGAQVTDLLPAGLTFLSSVASVGTYNSGTGVWNIGPLANTASATLSLVATVTSTATLTNTATKTAEDQIDPVSGNNSASVTLTALGADIAITKTVNNSTPNLGSNVTFTITATNNGPGNATGVQVTDLLPAGLTFVSSVATAGTYDSGTGIWNLGPLANLGSATLSLIATVTSTAAVTNTATKTAEDQLDPVSGNNAASATITPVSADIGVTKIVSNPTPNLGSNVSFTITATNNGPSNATGVQVTDLLPAGLTLVSFVASVGTYDSVTGVWNIGPLANLANATLSLVATVASTATLTNTATKTAEDQVDPVSGNNAATATVTAPGADIAITKTVSNLTPNLGSNVTFTITATNLGPGNATGVQVTDVLPAGLTLVSLVASVGTYDSGTGVWNIGPLANLANATLSLVASATSTAALTNTATKTAEDQIDPVSGNNSASVTLTALGADIAITKTVNNSTPNLGSNVTFTVTATNHGPGNATGVQVTDLLPAGLTLVLATPSVGTYDSVTGLWNIGPLANLGSATLSLIATVTSTAAVTNTATKTAEDQLDTVSGNNAASATITPVSADIGVTKTVSNPTPNLGSNVTFTITATNNGPSNATGVQVTDLLPAGLTFVSFVASVGTYDSVTGVWNIGPLANLANATLSIVATVTSTATLTNTASKTAEDQIDPVSSNDSATVTLTALGADIAITKAVDNSAPNLGSNVTFTITATNLGPGNATGVQVTDLLPAGLTLVSFVASVGTYNSGTGVWNIGPLANRANATLAIIATVTSSATLTNTATKTAEDQIDPVSGNNSASVSLTALGADIAITKTVDNAAPNLGSNVTFTITATNNGPGNATGVQVTDLLPAGLTLVLATPSVGTYNSLTGVWNIGPLANLAGATLSLVATVTSTAPLTNTATKIAEDQIDPVSGNNSASVTITPVSADIAITKTVDIPTPNLGSMVIFTITATNNGPSNATGVQVTDLLPAGLIYFSAAASSGSYDPATGLWNIGPLTNGANATLSILVTVTSTATLTNTATKTAEDQIDPVSGNNSDTATLTALGADIAITKTVSNPTPNLGSNVTFTITAINNGPGNATGVQVTDLLPAGLTLVSFVASVGTYNSGTDVWNIGPLADFGTATLALIATVTSTAAVTNTATKSAEDQLDPVSSNNSASVTINPVSADIGVTKAVDNATPNLGATVTFTTIATNHGPSDATGVQVTDVLPAGLTFVSASSVGYTSGTGIWVIGPLANGASASLSIMATVTGTAAITNIATKTGEDQVDPVSGNNSASVTLTALGADIAITKIGSNPTPNLGANVTFTITATNNGPSNATGVQVTDLLPAGLTFVSFVASAGTYDSVTGVWNIGPLANLANATLSLVTTVTSTAAVTNTATKTAEDQIDSFPANNSASASVTGQSADIAITKTVSNPTPNLGSNVTFTVTATNNGPSDATGVQVTDLLPAGLTFVSGTASVGTYNPVTHIWNIGPLANLASATLSLVATVTSTATVTNTATKSAELQPDLVPSNDSASVNVTGQSADIAFTKTVSNPTPNLGSNVTFTIVATNNGPSDATGVQVTDLLPAGLTFVSASSVGYTSGTGIWVIGPLANGASATLSIVATVTSTATLTNTATKTAELQPDLVPSNDSASVNVTGQSADIGVTKTVDNATPNLGSTVTFTITATNHGPSNATGVQVTDVLPAGLTFVSATPSVGTYDPVTHIWNIGPLANGAVATLSIIATATRTTAVINIAAVAGNQPDSNSANNSASASVTGQSADVGVTKTVDNATPNLGSTVTFTITATNHGPSDATGVQVTDLLPAGLTFVSFVASVGTYSSGTGVWNIGPLANGASATLSIIATATRTTAVINAATVAADQPDSNSANNSASATVTGQSADIGVTKTVDNATPNLGSTVTFTITATNHGPSDATGIQVTDVLPAGLTFVSATPSVGTYDPVTHIWNIGPLANGAVATLSIIATATRTTAVVNAATVAGNQPDSNSANNSASASVTGQSADIAITKTVSNPTPNLGSNVTFTVTATNHGPSDATGIQVTDLLPAGLTFVSFVASVGTYSSGTGVWNIGPLANLANATLSIVATVTSTATLTNTATKSAELQPDLVPSTDSASVNVSGQSADIGVTKTIDNASPNLGSNVTFTIVATNNGPSDATGVQVTDLLPAGLTFVSASSVGYTSGTGIWVIGPLANGASSTLSIVATVTSTATVTNTATKSAELQPDLVPSNDSTSVNVSGQSADIGVTKTVDNATPNLGSAVTFTITATNHGPSNATGVQVTDVLPAGLAFVSVTPSAGSYNPATGIWMIGALANTASATLLIIATVTATTAVTNTATKTAEDQADAVSANNSASATVTDAPALPGLPNTSGLDASAGEPLPYGPTRIPDLTIAILALIAGLGAVVLAGLGVRRNRDRFGQLRATSHQRHRVGRLAGCLIAIALSLAPSSLSVGEGASQPAVALALGTQLIGSKVVSMVPPPARRVEIFHQAAGPIFPSRLRIPSIGVDAMVGAVGLRADGSMDVPDNLWTSSWLADGPRPGEAGNAVIAGHRGVGSPALFSHLENVQPGDKIFISDEAGNTLIYVVTGVASLDLSRSTQVAVFENGPTSQLVLITCFGDYIASARTYDHRLVVFSKPLPLNSS